MAKFFMQRLTVTFAVIMSMSVLAVPAMADNNQPTATVVSSSLTGTVMGASASASDFASGKIVVLSDVLLKRGVKITHKQSPKGCHWIAGGWWNSGHDANGKLWWFRDSVPAEVCPSKASPTGWVKVAGGMTGRKCYNPAKVGPVPPSRNVVHGKVIMIRSFANVRMTLRAAVSVKVTAVCGYASADASSQSVVLVRAYVRSKGEVFTHLFSQVSGEASAKASAKLNCVVTPPIPVPPAPPAPPVTPPPPPVTPAPPMCSNVTTPENAKGGIEADGETYPGVVTVSAKNGDSITVSFGAQLGSFATHSVTFVSTGIDSIGWLYRAPADESTVGQSDQITVQVHDNTTGLNGASCASGWFLISAAPGFPTS